MSLIPHPITVGRWDVLVVFFPFTERAAAKRRPALVLSDATFNTSGHIVLAMITSAARTRWATDVTLTDFASAGLSAPSMVRLKLFTLDNRLIVKVIGALIEADAQSVQARLRAVSP